MQRVHFSLKKPLSSGLTSLSLNSEKYFSHDAFKKLKKNISLYKWRKLQSIKLELKWSGKISSKDLGEFIKCLGINLKGLRQLSLDFQK